MTVQIGREKLAVLGGKPVIGRIFPTYRSIGEEEVKAVTNVARSGCLSGFYGSWGDEFFGGPMVKQFEEAWSRKFGVKHTVSVNSATSGLFAAMGAIGVEPGDEVIVPPFTMSATAMAPIIYGGIPVFVDIEPDTFCLDLDAVMQAITRRTKAILVVNLFGHPAHLAELRKIADEHGIFIVEDNAQAPMAMESGRYAGTIGHIGVFSLNYHKHIHTGEGGMCVTQDKDLALRMQMIRNHGENIVEPLGFKNISGMVGFNYRMSELSATVGIEQLKKIETHVQGRVNIAERLTDGVAEMTGLIAPVVRSGCKHVYYVWAARVKERVLGVSRAQLSKALEAEGFPHFTAYTRPLYRLPMFRRRMAFGKYPFNLSKVKYSNGMCPVAERMYKKELLCFEPCRFNLGEADIDSLVEALQKVYEQRGALRSL
jgi:perosamine synthetase